MLKAREKCSFVYSPLKAILWSLIGLLFMSPAVATEPLSRIQDVGHYGVGGLECHELNAENPIFGRHQEKLLHWATGYLSGIATWMKSEGFEATVRWDESMSERMKLFLQQYCNMYPKDNISSAVGSFYKFRLLPEPMD